MTNNVDLNSIRFDIFEWTTMGWCSLGDGYTNISKQEADFAYKRLISEGNNPRHIKAMPTGTVPTSVLDRF